jgi:molybdopterin converting factor small subunit
MMPTVILTGPIREHAGGLGAVEVGGETVRTAIAALEASHPALRGWVVDERGVLRRHVKLFHRGASVSLDAPLGPSDELHIVVAAISGG